MATKSSNYSISVDVVLGNLNTIQKQLNSIHFTVGDKQFGVVANGLNQVAQGAEKVSDQAEYMGLTFQEANLIMQRSVQAISAMVEQVYELDGALTEFKKVSDLSGDSLDKYVGKLQDMGVEVARTGKPNGLSQNVRIVNVH